MPSQSFSKFWYTDLTRDCLLSMLDTSTLKDLRLVCHDFAATTSRHLFRDVSITFRSSTFTKPARMAALERIGGHIRTVTFVMEHTAETFLPPLLDPGTGDEVSFVFTPLARCPTPPANATPTNRGPTEPTYGTWEMTDLLIKQYPPLFHAAMNVSSFACALTYMPSLQHLRVNCAGQDPIYRYRRSVVDYALSSLRIAIEQAPLPRLEELSLTPIHPGGIQYLCPMAGMGSLPNSCKRWTRIRKLDIHMDTFPFEKGQATDHLKFLHLFMFHWTDTKGKGPSPLSLATEPALCELAARSQACPKTRHYLRPLKFPHLQYMVLGNAVLDASQVSDFLTEHRHSLLEFDFENVSLRSGTWEDALIPWRTLSSAEYEGAWGEKQQPEVEVMEVPLVLSANPLVGESSPPEQHKRRKRKKKKRHTKTTEVLPNNDLYASTAAMLLEEEPVHRPNLNFRTLREGLSNWARSKRTLWKNHDFLHKTVQSPILV
ncbi:conserved hypothetical protein [Talaromyces stipitatus ATCC 10500]|uniref:F-box domain protein n=1 Tax=Talaromyces stipitatus (strain ATCC 10500 / CBS 375.48 / QM 6759 / NRRL 1006) TaxID=441959 RepID=B8M986_TALSN|nr:uncharacterized protein TSTA_112150 [Talaromyces stipitatus ATCC 10500]EED17381.1 conserved hypothetical protein [Talaromyces stipitatus ATCC 10500]